MTTDAPGVTAPQDSGSILCLSALSAQNIIVKLKSDTNTNIRQWFYFDIDGIADQEVTVTIANANRVMSEWAWKDYAAFGSYDKCTWFRVSSRYAQSQFTITHQSLQSQLSLAYFPPFPLEQHRQFIGDLIQDGVHHEKLTTTPDGHALDLLRFGEPDANKKICWIVGRQHPGETMAQWWMLGLAQALRKSASDQKDDLLNRIVFYVVPNMNPDGTFRGHHRSAAAGQDMNRLWQSATATSCPEIYSVKEKMRETGVDFSIDVHGDEVIPAVFMHAATGVLNYNSGMAQRHDAFRTHLAQANRLFQTKYGYPATAPGSARLGLCSNFIAHSFDCAAVTLEMPFKSAIDCAGQRQPWGPEDCIQLGRDCVTAMRGVWYTPQ